MEVLNNNLVGGSLQISTDVIAKIAKCAALEVEGVADVACGNQRKMKELLEIVSLQPPVEVEMHDGIAEITVQLVVNYGTRIPAISEKVQENVKSSVQNMTNVAVGRVNLVIAGVALPQPEEE
ncbi:MAG: Asp23/Gls24 family envelope stress response protein [Faecalibacterium sp.]|nr:Asp23/Gls24 family envelope stress response protein [Faecalibacterium sp.]